MNTSHVLKGGKQGLLSCCQVLQGLSRVQTLSSHMSAHRLVFLGTCEIGDVSAEFWGISSQIPLEGGIRLHLGSKAKIIY